MNARVLELIQNPELFQNQDLDILNSEIKKHPYIQNIRALHLFGIHRFRPEEYQNALSTTAAYTTDKKILYQFINKNPKPEKTQRPAENIINQSVITNENAEQIFTEIKSVSKPQPKPVYVNGTVNRILFEGEEDFLEQKNDVIDLESTMESGQLVTQSTEMESAKDVNLTEETQIDSVVETAKTEIVVPETVNPDNEIQQEKSSPEVFSEVSFQATEVPEIQHEISEESEIITEETENTNQQEIFNNDNSPPETGAVENPSEINFHGNEEFLSDVKIVYKNSESKPYEVPKPSLNKHEIEMQRLIAEVEAKMKSVKKVKIAEKEETHQNTDLNFSETQNFEISKSEKEVAERKNKDIIKTKVVEEITETPEVRETIEIIQNAVPSEKREWKPMSFSGNTPDSLINKKEGKPEQQIISPEPVTKKTETVTQSFPEEKSEERPVFNVSFFTQNVSSIESEKVEKPAEQDAKAEESNVPTFINTWQNWLQIDRNKLETEEKPIISKEEVKNKVIENFLVKEPKISKLKEESDFVVKEKGDNISHLMTETLAKLYIEQKLYSKAIKAYQILSKKHPGKKSHFDKQINHIKDLRQNK